MRVFFLLNSEGKNILLGYFLFNVSGRNPSNSPWDSCNLIAIGCGSELLSFAIYICSNYFTLILLYS